MDPWYKTEKGQAYRRSERFRAPQRALKTSLSRKKRAYTSFYKQVFGCADCGYNAHAIALDFDHRQGSEKFREVSILVCGGSWSLDVVKAEIAKCDVVCANCHRVRTSNRAMGDPE